LESCPLWRLETDIVGRERRHRGGMREGAAIDGDKERGSSGAEDGVEVELGRGQEQSW